MNAKIYKLGDLIEPYNQVCGIPNLSPDEVSGINREKEFFEPSNQVGENTSKYKVVPANYFACNLMHVGRDIVLPLSLNHTNKDKYVSPAYSVFKLRDGAPVLREYFFMIFKSVEKDRFFWFYTDSSIRQGLSWADFCDVEITLPPLPVQKKYVTIYQAMQENLKNYESGLEDLKLTCDSYIEQLRKKYVPEKIGKYIEEPNNKNELGEKLPNRSVSNSKIFVDAKEAVVGGVDTKNYLIVEYNDFAYNTVTTRNADKLSISLNREYRCLVSPIYTTFRVKNLKKTFT